MTYDDCACTRSSSASPGPTATRSRPSDYRSRCSSAAPTAGFYAPACPRSATRYQPTHLCATREQAEQARELVAAVLDGLGLRLHPAKTRIAHLARGAEGFDFLGFQHRMRESWKWRGRWYLQKWPSQRAMASIRGKIRERTARRYARLPLEDTVENVNHVVRGWGNYFCYGNSGEKFSQIDSYAHERLAILASTKHGLTGRNWVARFNHEWCTRIGVYRLTSILGQGNVLRFIGVGSV